MPVFKFFCKKDEIPKMQFRTKTVSDWSLNWLEFLNSKTIISTILYETIANVSPTTEGGREKLQRWKRQIAMEIKSKRGELAHNPKNHYVVSLGMRFHTKNHGVGQIDVDNFIKPILDGIAAGLFCDENDDLSILERYNQFDDSNFRHLYVERVVNDEPQKEEGVSIVVSEISTILP